MPYEVRKVRHKRATRKAMVRAELRKNVTPYMIDPVRMYRYESELLLRVLARWISHRGYAPRTHEFAVKKRFDEKATTKYLHDLERAQLVVKNPQKGWQLTAEGFASLNLVPVYPELPTDPVMRRKLIREAISAQKVSPQLQAALKFYHGSKKIIKEAKAFAQGA